LLSDISSQMTKSNHELKQQVFDVLTQKCYRCPGCARRTPNAER
jgi:hypothetical protein